MPSPRATSDVGVTQNVPADTGARTRLTLGVFGSATSAQRRSPWLIAALLIIGSAIALFRLPPSVWNILWAEDGAVFLKGAVINGPGAWVAPYSGYLNTVPRILASLVVAVTRLEWAPLGITIVAALCTGALATAVFLFARERIASRWIQLLLWLQVAILPVAGGEVADSIANLHWYLIYVAFWAALVRPTARWLRIIQCIVIAAAVLSDPLALALLLPLVIGRIVLVPRGRQWLVVWVYVASSLLQIAGTIVGTLVQHSRTASTLTPTVRQLIELYGARVATGSVVGINLTPSVVGHLGSFAPEIVIACFIIVFALVAIFDRERRILVILFAAASFGFAMVVFYLQWSGLAGGGLLGLHVGERYMVVATFLLVAAQCVVIDSIAAKLTGSRKLVPITLFAVLVVAIGVTNYRVWDVRAGVPTWTSALRVAEQRCTLATAPGASVLVTIAPLVVPGPRLPCTVVLNSTR
jgi:hypothetical protein